MAAILIVLGILVALGLAGACSWQVYSTYKSMPPGATREVLYPKYRPTIEAVDAILFESGSLAEAREKFRTIVVQEDVLLIEIKPDKGFEDEVVFKRVQHSGKSMTAFGGAGYGSVVTKFGRIPAYVISSEAELNTGVPVGYVIYLRDAAASVPSDGTALEAE